jgi:hypothetical protein
MLVVIRSQQSAIVAPKKSYFALTLAREMKGDKAAKKDLTDFVTSDILCPVLSS